MLSSSRDSSHSRVDDSGQATSSNPTPDPGGQLDLVTDGVGRGVGAGREGVGGSVDGGSHEAVCAAAGAAGGSARSGGGSSLPSESLPPEVFYSMKLVTGKDAVGTLSGPGTLGIERRVKGEEGGVEGGGVGRSGGAICGASGEDKRSTVRTLVDALSWGKGDAGKGGAGTDAAPVSAGG